ncbi:hypothetical protein SSX86_002219 [Deinandra increscens subsp. villosa]|uniref:Replication factor A C-terminal domain-containing protein n=1 Tax=Deinandra increscens subsp. villosa TaxID=3103831 RepID=A0AAP0HB24_9ASTR
MILLDQEDNRITASCLSRFLGLLQNFFVEQNVLCIQKPILGENTGNWRFIDHPLKVCFNSDSVLSIADKWSGTEHGFSFVDFERITKHKVSKVVSIDIIGEVVWSSAKSHFKTTTNQDSKKITVKLQDLSGMKIFVTLFDQYCDQMCQYITEHVEMTHFPVILQFGKFSVYKGRYSVSNAYDGSLLFINTDDVKEIASFRDSFTTIFEGQTSASFSSISKSMHYSLESGFLTITDFCNTAEVDSVTEAKDLIVMGTIKFIDPKWYYMACNWCMMKVEKSDNGAEVIYSCTSEECIKEKRVIDAFPRFKIMLKVQDQTGTVDLIMFEGGAKQVIKKTATDILGSPPPSKTAAIVEVLPQELQELIDRKFAIKINVKTFSITNRYRTYTIAKITDNPVIMRSLDNKHNSEQVLSLEGSDTTVKDCMAFSENNGTPESVGNALKVIDSEKDYEGVKRNLSDIYDVDDLSITNSAKSRSTSSGKCSTSCSEGEEQLQVAGTVLIIEFQGSSKAEARKSVM